MNRTVKVPFFDVQVRKTITILTQVPLSIFISQGIKKDVFYSTSQLNISNILVFCFFLHYSMFLVRAFRPANVSCPTGIILSGGRINPPWE